MSEPIPPYHEKLPDLDREMTERGNLGILVLDAGPLGSIEDEYGVRAYEEVRQRLFSIIEDGRGKDYRAGDHLCLDRPRGLRFLFFLDRKRRRNIPMSVADLRAARARLISSLVPNLARAAFPFVKAPQLEVGYGLAVYNPLLHPARIVERAIDEAVERAAHQRRSDELLVLERLQDVLLRENVITAYQPILKMKEGTIHGFEALSRGPRGSGLESAGALFEAAENHRLRVELDRLCRRRALLSAAGRIPSNAQIFVNTLPATMRDPQFRGKALIDFLDRADVKPDRIVIEITEKEIIKNYALFRDMMGDFTALGMTFAVDDVGSGYSGLESIAKLKPSYLKIDIELIKNVNVNVVNRAMVKAIIALGHGIGAKVIGEGIQTEEEAQVLRAYGVDYGQGFHLGRPKQPTET